MNYGVSSRVYTNVKSSVATIDQSQAYAEGRYLEDSQLKGVNLLMGCAISLMDMLKFPR